MSIRSCLWSLAGAKSGDAFGTDSKGATATTRDNDNRVCDCKSCSSVSARVLEARIGTARSRAVEGTGGRLSSAGAC